MSIKKILVVRFRRVGDAVLTLALCSSLRKTFPTAQIDYVLNSSIAPLCNHHPDIDNVITFSNDDNSNLFRYLIKVWKLMRSNKYDVVIDVRSTVRTLLFSLFSLSSRYRIGTKKSYNFLIHNYRINNRADKTTDVVSHLLMLLSPLEAEADVKYCSDFRLHISQEEKVIFREYMVRQGIDFSRPLVLVAAAARLEHKIWNKERMKEILQRMIEKYQVQVVLNFTQDERNFVQELYDSMSNKENVFINIEANSLRELAALLVNSDFFFGNEGGARHMAQALDVPSFAIFPPSIPKAMWLPGDGTRHRGASPADVVSIERQAPMTYQQCFELITVDQVWDELDRMLKKYLVSSAGT